MQVSFMCDIMCDTSEQKGLPAYAIQQLSHLWLDAQAASGNAVTSTCWSHAALTR